MLTFKELLLLYISDNIESVLDDIKEMKAARISDHAPGMGMAIGSLETLRDIKKFINEYKEDNSCTPPLGQ